MWLPYQSSLASSASMPLEGHYTSSHSPLASSEASSGSSSPVSTASADNNKLSLSNLLHGYAPSYTEEDNKLCTSADSSDELAPYAHAHPATSGSGHALKRESIHYQDTASTDNDVANSSASTESSNSADGSPTYRSPQAPSYNSTAPHMYSHSQQSSAYMSHGQYGHESSQYSYFNAANRDR